jgi:hypothetical protein
MNPSRCAYTCNHIIADPSKQAGSGLFQQISRSGSSHALQKLEFACHSALNSEYNLQAYDTTGTKGIGSIEARKKGGRARFAASALVAFTGIEGGLK